VLSSSAWDPGIGHVGMVQSCTRSDCHIQTGHEEVFLYREGGLVSVRGGECPKPVSG